MNCSAGVDVTQGPEVGWQEPPGLGRAIVIGSAIAVAVSFVGVTIGMVVFGAGLGAAVGLGAFVAFWGGLGFGSMVGGVVWASGLEDSAQHAPCAEGPSQQGATAEPVVVEALRA